MKTWIRVGSAVTIALLAGTTLATGVAVARDRKGAASDQNQPAAAPGAQRPCPPQKITGKITALDPANDMVTVQASDGTAHQFKASREDMQTFKVGDNLDMTLRSAPNC
jgi:hypothetical protein